MIIEIGIGIISLIVIIGFINKKRDEEEEHRIRANAVNSSNTPGWGQYSIK